MRKLVVYLSVAAIVASSCQVVRPGTRCRSGVGFARSATHVMTCANGRWREAITIEGATRAILMSIPAEVTMSSAITSGVAGERSLATVIAAARVVNRSGQAVAGASVRFELPPGGAGLEGPPVEIVTTDRFGLARLVRSASFRGIAGAFTIRASVSDLVPPAEARVVVDPGPPVTGRATSPTQLTVRAGEIASFEFESVDRFGNLSSPDDFGGLIVTSTPINGTGEWFRDRPSIGRVRFFSAPLTRVGEIGFRLRLARSIGAPFAEIPISVTVLANVPAQATFSGINPIAVPVNTQLSSAVFTEVTDAFGNFIPEVPTTYEVVPGPNGAAGTLSAPIVNPGTGAYVLVTANAIAGDWKVRARVEGVGMTDLTVRNLAPF